ncbi:MAG TPA: hypothetical protein VIG33_07775 [Pseudobdellovibrionaceae bacterium]|jgi:hypothetical protein
MDLERIQYRGFKPRGEVKKEATKIAQKFLEEFPIEGTAKVVIADQGEHFHISVVGISENKLFSSEAVHRKKNINGWPRTWQLGALVELLGDFVQQVRGSFKSQDKP